MKYQKASEGDSGLFKIYEEKSAGRLKGSDRIYHHLTRTRDKIHTKFRSQKHYSLRLIFFSNNIFAEMINYDFCFISFLFLNPAGVFRMTK